MKKYYFYSKIDSKKEAIDSVRAFSRLHAAKYFASRKHFTLKQFLGIFSISK